MEQHKDAFVDDAGTRDHGATAATVHIKKLDFFILAASCDGCVGFGKSLRAGGSRVRARAPFFLTRSVMASVGVVRVGCLLEGKY
jgi:hypothetical protein